MEQSAIPSWLIWPHKIFLEPTEVKYMLQKTILTRTYPNIAALIRFAEEAEQIPGLVDEDSPDAWMERKILDLGRLYQQLSRFVEELDWRQEFERVVPLTSESAIQTAIRERFQFVLPLDEQQLAYLTRRLQLCLENERVEVLDDACELQVEEPVEGSVLEYKLIRSRESHLFVRFWNWFQKDSTREDLLGYRNFFRFRAWHLQSAEISEPNPNVQTLGNQLNSESLQ